MHANTIIALVGEQPIPILLPILNEQATNLIDQVVLVCTTQTESVGKRLKKVLQEKSIAVNKIEILCVEPYNILKTKERCSSLLMNSGLTKSESYLTLPVVLSLCL